MIEDKLFCRIYLRLLEIHPKSTVFVGKQYTASKMGHGVCMSVKYTLICTEHIYRVFMSVNELVDFVDGYMAERDAGVAKRRMIRNRDWDALFGKN